jgi:hypothetical protein
MPHPLAIAVLAIIAATAFALTPVAFWPVTLPLYMASAFGLFLIANPPF